MKLNALTEGALLCAISVILALLSYYVPFMTLLFFFVPVPMVIVCLRHGLKTVTLSGIAATGLLLLFVDPISALFSGVYLLLAGLMIGSTYLYKKSDFIKLTAAWGSIILTMVLILAVSSALSGQNLIVAISKEMDAILNEAMQIYQNTGLLDSAQLSEMEGLLKEMMTTVKMMIPAAFLIMPFILGWINILLSDTVLKRLKLETKGIRPLKDWRVPLSFRRFLVIATVVLFFLSLMDDNQMISNYVYTGIILLYVVFFCMGLSFVFWFMAFHWKKEHIGYKILVVVLCIIIPVVVQLVELMGMIDIFVNIRQIIVMKKGDRK